MKQFVKKTKLSVVLSIIILAITVAATSDALAQEQTKTQENETKKSEKTVPQTLPQSVPSLSAASIKQSATLIKPEAGTHQMSQSQMSQSDLLAGVRSQVSRLRSVPIGGGANILRDSKAHRDADQIKLLHDWHGESTEASWPFTIGKSKK